MNKPIESINPPKKPTIENLEKKAEEATKLGKKSKASNKASGEDIDKLEVDEGVEQKGGITKPFPPIKPGNPPRLPDPRLPDQPTPPIKPPPSDPPSNNDEEDEGGG